MKRLLPLFLCLLLLLSGCGSSSGQEDEAALHIVATTYPVYLFANSIVGDTEGVEVTQLITQEVSCLHDYTLTVTDMKAIEKADVIILSGAGLEDFMADALAQSNAAVIDCSAGAELLPASGHEHHDAGEDGDAGHYDPHFWMTEDGALSMMNSICDGLSALDEPHAAAYAANRNEAASLLPVDPLDGSTLSCPYLITFHDGFQYFAQANGLTLLKAIEEEEGSEASAAEIKEIVSLIKEYHIPAIFTEKSGSDATAQAIARETGVAVYQLDMIMSGSGQDVSAYVDAMNSNYAVIREALS